MPDTNTQETKEQDPVEGIRSALNQAMGFLKRLLGQEEGELKEELEEVEGTSKTDESRPDQPAEGAGG